MTQHVLDDPIDVCEVTSDAAVDILLPCFLPSSAVLTHAQKMIEYEK
jgi:hypothetical protein